MTYLMLLLRDFLILGLLATGIPIILKALNFYICTYFIYFCSWIVHNEGEQLSVIFRLMVLLFIKAFLFPGIILYLKPLSFLEIRRLEPGKYHPWNRYSGI